jgi:Flp pilus assembly protein TadD
MLRPALIAAAVLVAVATAVVFGLRWFTALPAPGSEAYEQVAGAFFRGLASLEVGLLDDAKREFTTVTTTVPREPAGWANLGLAHLRLGEFDAAAEPISRAMTLAPTNADLVLLAGRMEIARGRLDEGVAHLRRSVELSPSGLQPRFALAEEVERAAAPEGDAQALALLDELVTLAPQNIAVLVERARAAAKANDRQRLDDSIARLKPLASNWPPPAVEQYQDLQKAVAESDFATAQRTTLFLRNVLARVPAFAEDLTTIRTSAELIAEPIERFVAMVSPSPIPAPADAQLRFSPESIDSPSPGPEPQWLFTVASGDKAVPDVYETVGDIARRVGNPEVGRFPIVDGTDPTSRAIVVADLNNDFRNDIALAGIGYVQVLSQQEDGAFRKEPLVAMNCRELSVTDVEMDGDLDLVCAGMHSGAPTMLRNNGNGTWTSAPMFGNIELAGLAWGDLDNDGDSDAVAVERIATGQRLQAFFNRQAGAFVGDILQEPPPAGTFKAITVADIDADGIFDIITLDSDGRIRRTWLHGSWRSVEIAAWDKFDFRTADVRLLTGDLDNNGALDLIAAGGGQSRVWLANERHELVSLAAQPAGEVFDVVDFNSDGRLDLLALASATDGVAPADRRQAVRLVNHGTTNYHWKQIRPRAQQTAGDQRINSFGMGGYIEARAGLLFQRQPLTGGPVHIGLGTHSTIDVVRIVWPNGVPQAEFGTSVDDTVVIEQRLKGSCPWLFTWDGTRMVFVTDFLWRSPLGLRINAQDTAGVTQTEDWVRVRGDQLVARYGHYDVRITAELWETHFFDHVSLMAVDHPDGTEVFVDERFSPAAPPALAVHALKDLRPVTRAIDDRGADVTATIAARDGKYLSTFRRGRYQGIADDHFVELEIGNAGADAMLVANGWIYPTDSSINVAIAQAGIAPRGLSLEAQNTDGSWRVVRDDLGFPAGKNKTILIDLKAIAGARWIRLRTNLEIYWDSLLLGSRAASPVKTTRIDASTAELRYRGFSHTGPPEGGHYGAVSPRGDAPETPDYDRLASTSPRWRDLTGYHTRFGDVRELIEKVDDRYVIMNAGDEMRLQFAEAPPPGAGWRRDFVVIGDGWEKDGDYNTEFSQTVLPLPSHDRPNYGAGTTSLALEDDPVYQRHRDDWQRYHTRYVTPRRFLNGLKPSNRN